MVIPVRIVLHRPVQSPICGGKLVTKKLSLLCAWLIDTSFIGYLLVHARPTVGAIIKRIFLWCSVNTHKHFTASTLPFTAVLFPPSMPHRGNISGGFFVDKCHPITCARLARFFAAYLVAMSTYKLLCSVFTYVFFHASFNLHFVPRKITPSKICSW